MVVLPRTAQLAEPGFPSRLAMRQGTGVARRSAVSSCRSNLFWRASENAGHAAPHSYHGAFKLPTDKDCSAAWPAASRMLSSHPCLPMLEPREQQHGGRGMNPVRSRPQRDISILAGLEEKLQRSAAGSPQDDPPLSFGDIVRKTLRKCVSGRIGALGSKLGACLAAPWPPSAKSNAIVVQLVPAAY